MVYIIKYLRFTYDDSESEIIGICDSQKKAFKYAINSILEKLDYNHYDPRERYYSRTEYSLAKKKDIIRHTDQWECMVGCSRYTIEEWETNNKNGNKLMMWYINIDKALKTYILENKLMPEMVTPYIKSIKNKLDTIEFCMEEKEDHFGLPWKQRKAPTDDIVEKWNKFYDKKIDKESNY